MSSEHRYVPVRMVRIQAQDRKQPITHNNQVTVGILEDSDTDTVYLRIRVNGQSILSEELDHFKWLEESSTDGAVTLDLSLSKIIIIYDSKDKACCSLFARMKQFLQKGTQQKPITPSIPQPTQSNEEHIQMATDDLVNDIKAGSLDGAEHAVRFLAESRANLSFTLINRDDNKNKTATKKPETKPSLNTIRLKLQIECHLNKAPLTSTIIVRSGTTLRVLKDQIEIKTGIRRKDQYWYAFDQYIIDDDYEFGSSQPVVPPLPKNAPTKQIQPPTDPVRSNDTLILYIAQLRPYDK